MGECKGVLLRESVFEGLQGLNYDQIGKIVMALFIKSCGKGEMPELNQMEKVVLNLIWPSVKDAQDRARHNSEIHRKSGVLGGRPTANQKVNNEKVNNQMVSEITKTNQMVSATNQDGQYKSNQDKENINIPPIAPQGAELPANPVRAKNEYAEDFSEFWKAYPKSCNKMQGYKAWQKAQKEHRLPEQEKLLELLGQAVAAYRATHASADGFQYFKDASTWLNNNGWEDMQAKQTPTPVAPAPAAPADDARARREQEEKARQKALFKSEHRRIMEEIRRRNETY